MKSRRVRSMTGDRRGSRQAPRSRLALVLASCLLSGGLQVAGTRAEAATPAPPPTCAQASCDDPLFTVQYPHTGTFTTDAGVIVPLPLHYYAGSSAILVGTGDLGVEARLLAGTPLAPVATSDGHGIVGLDIEHFTDTDLGPCDEVLLVFVAHAGRAAAVPADPGGLLASFFNPDNALWAVRVIVGAQLPIDVGRQYLGVPKDRDVKRLKHDLSTSSVSFADAEPNGRPIISAHIPMHPDASVSSIATRTEDLTSLTRETLMRQGNVHVHGSFHDVRHPAALSTMHAVLHATDPTSIAVSTFGDDATFTAYANGMGADILSLGFTPTLTAYVGGLRAVVDGTL